LTYLGKSVLNIYGLNGVITYFQLAGRAHQLHTRAIWWELHHSLDSWTLMYVDGIMSKR
jgi:hypothetical protein